MKSLLTNESKVKIIVSCVLKFFSTKQYWNWLLRLFLIFSTIASVFYLPCDVHGKLKNFNNIEHFIYFHFRGCVCLTGGNLIFYCVKHSFCALTSLNFNYRDITLEKAQVSYFGRQWHISHFVVGMQRIQCVNNTQNVWWW